jgi:hypothetical protein
MRNTIKAVLDEYYNVNMFSEIARSQIAEKIEEALKKNDGKSTQHLNDVGVPTPVISTTENIQPVVAKTVDKPTAVVKTREKDDKVKKSPKKENVKKEAPKPTKDVSTPKKGGGFKNLGNKGVSSGRKTNKRTRTRTKKSR